MSATVGVAGVAAVAVAGVGAVLPLDSVRLVDAWTAVSTLGGLTVRVRTLSAEPLRRIIGAGAGRTALSSRDDRALSPGAGVPARSWAVLGSASGWPARG